jgi:hypothetical protein
MRRVGVAMNAVIPHPHSSTEQYWRFINADLEEFYDGYLWQETPRAKASLVELGWNSPLNPTRMSG